VDRPAGVVGEAELERERALLVIDETGLVLLERYIDPDEEVFANRDTSLERNGGSDGLGVPSRPGVKPTA